MKYLYRKVNIKNYLKDNFLLTVKACKTSFISVRKPLRNEVIITFSNGIVELKNRAKRNNFVAIKLNRNNEPFIDQTGNKNEWIIHSSYLEKHYELISNNIYKPKKIVESFKQVNESISFKTKLGIMNIEKGGYLNVTNYKYIYGIQEKDFMDTYQIVED